MKKVLVVLLYFKPQFDYMIFNIKHYVDMLFICKNEESLRFALEDKIIEVKALQNVYNKSVNDLKKHKKENENLTHKYKHLSELEDSITPNKEKLSIWFADVIDGNKNTCDICSYKEHKEYKESDSNLTAYHLYDKDIHFTLMYAVENGVCLCKICNNELIAKYSALIRTPIIYNQFKNWKQNKLKHKLSL